jgi:hypothetical protein
MLSSSHPKIHEPPAIGVSRDTRTGDSTRNCERRADPWVPEIVLTVEAAPLRGQRGPAC